MEMRKLRRKNHTRFNGFHFLFCDSMSHSFSGKKVQQHFPSLIHNLFVFNTEPFCVQKRVVKFFEVCLTDHSIFESCNLPFLFWFTFAGAAQSLEHFCKQIFICDNVCLPTCSTGCPHQTTFFQYFQLLSRFEKFVPLEDWLFHLTL